MMLSEYFTSISEVKKDGGGGGGGDEDDDGMWF